MPGKSKMKKEKKDSSQAPTMPSAENVTYQDPILIEHQRPPTGDLYVMPGKSKMKKEKKDSSQAPTMPSAENVTYQDPILIERQ